MRGEGYDHPNDEKFTTSDLGDSACVVPFTVWCARQKVMEQKMSVRANLSSRRSKPLPITWGEITTSFFLYKDNKINLRII